MNDPDTPLGEADYNPTIRSYGILSNPWLVVNTTGDSVRFNHFKRLPDGDGYVSTPAHFMDRSLPRQHSMPSVEELKDKWHQYVGTARIAWGEFTEDELLKLEGNTQQLAGLIFERYAVTRDEADLQVQRFFAKHHF